MTRPNVLWLVSDHQAFANRGLDRALSPLQHRLAALGTRCARAYTVLPICTPSRASMLTGLYPHAHGLTENDGRFGGRAELEPSDAMVHQRFAAAGYRCGWFGKWHLTHARSAQDFGFEGMSLPGYGYPYHTPQYRAYLAGVQPGPLWAEIEVPGESRRAPGTWVDLCQETAWFDYEAGSARLHGPEEVHEAHFLADQAIRWIEAHGARNGAHGVHNGDGAHGVHNGAHNEDGPDAPFFMRLDTWGPHPPYTLPTGFDSPLQDGDIPLSANLSHDLATRPAHHAQYKQQWQQDLRQDSFDWPRLTRRALEHGILVERAMCRVIDCLERRGALENTVIVFCADHGDAVASNGGVMNKGSLLTEETIRIPMYLAGPGIAAGHRTEALMANVDIAPTLLDLCGLAGPGAGQGGAQGLDPGRGPVDAGRAHGMQGLSAADHLRHPDRPAARDQVLIQHYGLHLPILQRCLVRSQWKYVLQEDGFEELYDLEADPFECSNLAGKAPDPSLLHTL